MAKIKKNVFDSVKLQIEAELQEDKLHRIGRLVRDKTRSMLLGHIGQSQNKLADDIKYKVEDGRVVVYTNNIINKYIEEGTRPHKITPKKPGGSLRFMARESASYSDGTPIKTGDTVFAKEVNHPGTRPRPFFRQGLALSKQGIRRIIED